MKLSINTTCYLFVSALFLVISAEPLFSDGMFMDGLFYADISRNMAEGLGTFWTPYLSETQFAEFYEHPPLALGLQSVWFRIFGDSILVERFYSLFSVILTGAFIVLIWKRLAGSVKYGWLPLLLWITVTDVSWSTANNMLENTMAVFVVASVFFILTATERSRFLMLLLAGVSLSLGLLTKGFFCLYIWGLPFFYWLVLRKGSFKKMVGDTVMVVFFTILPLALLFVISEDASHNMITYFNKQVVGSIENVKTVNTRFAIIFKFLENAIIPVLLSVTAILAVGKVKKINKVPQGNIKMFLVMLALTLSGVFPIMISLKQRGFYILTVYPIFAIGLAFLIFPAVKVLFDSWSETNRGAKFFKGVSVFLAVGAVVISVFQVNRVGRDFDLVTESKIIIDEVGEGSTVGLCPDLSSKWNMFGYFVRYGHVSLDYKEPERHEFLVVKGGCSKVLDEKKYAPVELNTETYQLYRRVN